MDEEQTPAIHKGWQDGAVPLVGRIGKAPKLPGELMKAPKEKRPALASKPGVRRAAAYYATLALLANVSGSVFWFFEQRRGQLADWLDNERSAL